MERDQGVTLGDILHGEMKTSNEHFMRNDESAAHLSGWHCSAFAGCAQGRHFWRAGRAQCRGILFSLSTPAPSAAVLCGLALSTNVSAPDRIL